MPSDKQCQSTEGNFNKLFKEAAIICPLPLQVDILTMKVVSKLRVMCATSVPILVSLGLSVLELGPTYATDRHQTDKRQTSDAHHHLMPPPNGGRGITITSTYKLYT